MQITRELLNDVMNHYWFVGETADHKYAIMGYSLKTKIYNFPKNIYIFTPVTFFKGHDKHPNIFDVYKLCCKLKPMGRVAEWSKAAVLKTVSPKGDVGSNPTPSAIETKEIIWIVK